MINARDFDIRLTFESGQPLTFSADYSEHHNTKNLHYVTEKGAFFIKSTGNARSSKITYDFFGDYTKRSAEHEVLDRLGLSHDIKKVYQNINTDQFMDNAIKKLYGLRVTKNPPWETTLSFLVSQFNNIKRIRLIMKRLINTFGEEIKVNGSVIKLFPNPETIAEASIEQLKLCNTGFRAKYIKSTAKNWHKIKNQKFSRMKYQSAKEKVMQMEGVGDKVADCILLMAYAKYEAFPIDVWIKRVLEEQYLKKRSSIKYIHEFADRKWGTNAGYAQQYLYWYRRNLYSVKD